MEMDEALAMCLIWMPWILGRVHMYYSEHIQSLRTPNSVSALLPTKDVLDVLNHDSDWFLEDRGVT